MYYFDWDLLTRMAIAGGIGLLFLSVVFVPWISGMFRIRRRMTLHAVPALETFDPTALPADTAGFFSRTLESLREEGFEWIAFLTWKEMSERHIYAALMVNRETKDYGLAVHRAEGAEKKPTVTRYLTFWTRFIDSREIRSHNDPLPDLFFHPSEIRNFGFRQVRNVHHLYVLHRRVLARFAADKEPVLPPEGTEVKSFSDELARHYQRQTRSGNFNFDEMSNLLTPSLKGILALSLKQVWLLRLLSRMSRRRAANRLISKLLAEKKAGKTTASPGRNVHRPVKPAKAEKTAEKEGADS